MQQQSVICRVQNLTSPKGQALNGLAASFDPTVSSGSDGRLAVTIDGVKGPQLSLKPGNLHALKSFENLAVAVGRRDLRSPDFMATVVDQKRGKRVTAQMLSGGENLTALRSRGSLMALVKYFQNHRLPKGDIVFHLTDLNLALLLNSYSVRKEMVHSLDSNQHILAETVGKLIIRNCDKRVILFKYEPFRIHRNDRPANGMLKAVLSSKFHIYPCPCEDYLDALEVRFLLPGRSTHCLFLDFGEDETIQYARNLFSMGEEDTNRLKPDTLADIDPQMFWSSILHSKALVKVLRKIPTCPDELLKEWSNVYGCYLKSISTFKEVCFSASEAVRMLPDNNGKWNLLNDEIHYNIAFRNSKLAVLMSITDWTDAASRPARIELMDNYIGSEIDTKVAEFSKACASKDPQDLEFALQNMMLWNNTKTCDYCGKHEDQMFDCSRCQGAGYCSRACQRAAWPTHKKACKDLQKAMQDEPKETKPSFKLYKPKKQEKYARGVMHFSEACGVGFLNIIWFPANEKVPNVVAFTAKKSNTIFKTEVSAMQSRITSIEDLPKIFMNANGFKTFNNNLSDLEPIMRLCLSCGPIGNLKMAQLALHDALLQAKGSVINLKMKWVGFTPLEWAAKKGHMDIVKWLMLDPRTKLLINVGAPVGWACYTNRVNIARFLVNQGASPMITHEVFWDSRPPLLAAAENGKIDAVKFLVDECGVDVLTKWKGNGIKEHIRMSPNWDEMPDHQNLMKYATFKLKDKEQ